MKKFLSKITPHLLAGIILLTAAFVFVFRRDVLSNGGLIQSLFFAAFYYMLVQFIPDICKWLTERQRLRKYLKEFKSNIQHQIFVKDIYETLLTYTMKLELLILTAKFTDEKEIELLVKMIELKDDAAQLTQNRSCEAQQIRDLCINSIDKYVGCKRNKKFEI